jgi:HD-GYP domain-containing protein (c-di-GMP phosphodiesterase class II)
MEKDHIREQVGNIIKELAGCVQTRSMYSREHAMVQQTIEKIFKLLSNVLEVESEVTIGVIGDEIAWGKEPFYKISRQVYGFIKHLQDICVDKMSFIRGVGLEEFIDFIEILSIYAKSGEFQDHLAASNIEHIFVGKIGFRKNDVTWENSEEDIAIASKYFDQGGDLLDDINENIQRRKAIDINNVKEFVNGVMGSLLGNKSSLMILTAVKTHDEYSFVHNINVAIFSMMLAEGLGLGDNYLSDIGVAALLHDVGKLSIPGEILRKKGKLTDVEFGVIKNHTVNGAKVLLENEDVGALSAKTAFEHHLKYDNSGYPERLFHSEPGLVTMIVTIADVYDALRSKRAYAGEIAPEETYEEMVSLEGTTFHPGLLDQFFKLIGVYPPGTLVELDTREIGLVIKESVLDIKRPQVEVLYGTGGDILKSPIMVNLLEKDRKGEYKRTIKRSLIPSDDYSVPNKYTGAPDSETTT